MKSLPDLKVFSHSLNMKTFVQICEKWQRLQYKTQSWVFPSFQNFWFSRPWIIIGITKLIILEGKEKDFRKLLCKCFDALKWVTNNTNQIKKQPVEICYKKDFIKNETPVQVFSCKICEIFKSIFLQNTSRRLLNCFSKYSTQFHTKLICIDPNTFKQDIIITRIC